MHTIDLRSGNKVTEAPITNIEPKNRVYPLELSISLPFEGSEYSTMIGRYGGLNIGVGIWRWGLHCLCPFVSREVVYSPICNGYGDPNIGTACRKSHVDLGPKHKSCPNESGYEAKSMHLSR